jgi:hypothetical protein
LSAGTLLLRGTVGIDARTFAVFLRARAGFAAAFRLRACFFAFFAALRVVLRLAELLRRRAGPEAFRLAFTRGRRRFAVFLRLPARAAFRFAIT